LIAEEVLIAEEYLIPNDILSISQSVRQLRGNIAAVKTWQRQHFELKNRDGCIIQLMSAVPSRKA
jgi:hypothetical protein